MCIIKPQTIFWLSSTVAASLNCGWLVPINTCMPTRRTVRTDLSHEEKHQGSVVWREQRTAEIDPAVHNKITRTVWKNRQWQTGEDIRWCPDKSCHCLSKICMYLWHNHWWCQLQNMDILKVNTDQDPSKSWGRSSVGAPHKQYLHIYMFFFSYTSPTCI